MSMAALRVTSARCCAAPRYRGAARRIPTGPAARAPFARGEEAEKQGCARELSSTDCFCFASGAWKGGGLAGGGWVGRAVVGLVGVTRCAGVRRVRVRLAHLCAVGHELGGSLAQAKNHVLVFAQY